MKVNKLKNSKNNEETAEILQCKINVKKKKVWKKETWHNYMNP